MNKQNLSWLSTINFWNIVCSLALFGSLVVFVQVDLYPLMEQGKLSNLEMQPQTTISEK